MQLQIRIRNIDLADSLRTYIERRVRFSFSRFGGRLDRVMVRILDLNGPRSGKDKCCRISAEVVPSGKVVLEETDADLYAAIDRATQRAGRAIGRRLERARELRFE